MIFRAGSYTPDLNRPLVMGIVNVTPDSFSDGGQFSSTSLAIEHALKLVEEGADILDIGGESTRPNAEPVSLEEELRRVIPVIEGLAQRCNVPLSIDTYKPQVMKAAIAAGASLVNDVRGLQEPGAIEVVAASNVGVCLMHMPGTPQTMQSDPHYDDVVVEVRNFLLARAAACEAAGISRERIMLDPGFGFGKRSVHNIELLRELESLCGFGYPVLVGLSRKSVLGQITGKDVADRLPASLAAAVIAAMKGAAVVRVHDVKATRDALAVVAAIATTA
jgi:dihydropteroate synthase